MNTPIVTPTDSVKNTPKTTPPPTRNSDNSIPTSPPPTRSAIPNMVKPTTFSNEYEPEQSRLGLYITIGVISVLVILLIYQIISKSGLSAQIKTLQSQNTALQDQIASLEANQMAASSQSQSAVPENMRFYPAKYRNSIRQQIGQLLTASRDLTVVAVYLRGNGGSGENAELAIYQVSDPTAISDSQRPVVSKLFDASKIPANKKFAVQLDKPFTLQSGKQYLFAIRPSSSNAQANIGFSQSDSIGGSMWVYAQQIDQNGKVIQNNPRWQSIPNSDMIIDFKVQ